MCISAAYCARTILQYIVQKFRTIGAFPQHNVRKFRTIGAFPQHIVQKFRTIGAFPQHIVRFPQHKVRFPQHMVRFPQHIVRFPQHIVAIFRKVKFGNLYLNQNYLCCTNWNPYHCASTFLYCTVYIFTLSLYQAHKGVGPKHHTKVVNQGHLL